MIHFSVKAANKPKFWFSEESESHFSGRMLYFLSSLVFQVLFEQHLNDLNYKTFFSSIISLVVFVSNNVIDFFFSSSLGELSQLYWY